jgi:hypothetical protein
MFGDVTAAEILDRFVPVPAGEGDWSAIVRDANAARPRRRWIGVAAAVAGAMVAVAVTAMLAPSHHGGGSVIDRALAAIGNGPVLHVVTRSPYPEYELLDLATGERRTVYEQIEEWSDPKRGVRSIGREEGHVVYDSVWGVPEKDPALTSFMTGYREALSSGKAHVVGEGDVDGTAVYWLDLASTGSPEAEAQSHQVAVAKNNYAPVALRWVHGGKMEPVEPILEMQAEPEGSGNFDGVPQPKPVPDRGDVLGSTTIDVTDAPAALDTPPVWAGRAVADLPLSLVRRQGLKSVYPAAANLPTEMTTGLELVYGAVVNDHPDSRSAFVRIQEASSPAFAYGWIPTDPPLRSRKLRLKDYDAVAGSTRGDWYRGEVIMRGTYVVLEGYDRDAVVAAAKALGPLG